MKPVLKVGFYGKERVGHKTAKVSGPLKISNDSDLDLHDIHGSISVFGNNRLITNIPIAIQSMKARESMEAITHIEVLECDINDTFSHDLQARMNDNSAIAVDLNLVRFKIPLTPNELNGDPQPKGTRIGSLQQFGIQFAFAWYLAILGGLASIGSANFLPLRILGQAVMYLSIPSFIATLTLNFPRGVSQEYWSRNRKKILNTAFGPIAAVIIGGLISFAAITFGIITDEMKFVSSMLKIFGYCMILIGLLGSFSTIRWVFSTTVKE